MHIKECLHIYTLVSSAVQGEGTSLETQKELGIKKSKELDMKYQVWNEGAAFHITRYLQTDPKFQNFF